MADEQDEGMISKAGRGAMQAVGSALGSKALSTALMEGAFEKFGQAFTDTGFRGSRGGGGVAAGTSPAAMQPWRAAGQKAVSALEKRWQVMEYEDFKSQHIEGATQKLQTLQSQYQEANTMLDDGMWVNSVTGEPEMIDTTTPQGRDRLLRYRGELHTKFFTQVSDITTELSQEGVKYKGNEMIQEVLMNMFEQQSQQLNTVANPEEMLQGEKAYSDIAVQERNAAANEQQARAAAKAAKQADRPISVKEALADRNIGVEGILPWAEDTMMNSPQAGAYIEQGKAVLNEQLHSARETEERAAWRAAGKSESKFSYDKLDEENIAWVDSQLAQSGGAIQRAATVEFVRAKDPRALEAAKKHSPQYFSLMDGSDKPDAPKGVSDIRITDKQRDDNVKAWKQPLADKLDEYMSDPNNDPDIEVAIDFIVNEWLPGAITGETTSSAPSSIQATRSNRTSKYRELVTRFARHYLETHFDKISAIAKDRNKDKAKRARNLRASKARGRGRRGGGGLGRASKSLFGDE